MGYVVTFIERENSRFMCVHKNQMSFWYISFSRKRTKIRKKTKYTILDNIDEQERMELRPKYGKCYLFELRTYPPSLQSVCLN